MMTKRALATALVALSLTAGSVAPVLADGAASTRNILIGGAAAAAGTLLIINHNKQVHQRYADDARQQAQTQAQANNAQAAYAAERRAYSNEVTVNAEFQHEVATQHALIESLRKEVAVQKNRADAFQASARADRARVPAPPAVTDKTAVASPAGAASGPLHVATTSWGWGQF